MAHNDDLPLPDYDQLALGDLQHSVRSLDERQRHVERPDRAESIE